MNVEALFKPIKQGDNVIHVSIQCAENKNDCFGLAYFKGPQEGGLIAGVAILQNGSINCATLNKEGLLRLKAAVDEAVTYHEGD